MWWHIPIIPTLRRLTQEDLEFDSSLGYIVRSCLKRKRRWEGNKREGSEGKNVWAS
jgi:hypothetical protein